MAESGTLDGWIVPRVQDRPRLNKPPLIYWLQAASARSAWALGIQRTVIWPYRLPSLLAACITVVATWGICRSMFSPRAALLAGAVMATAPLVAWEARQARSDHVLVACTTLAMGALWRIWRRADHASHRDAVLFWSAIAAGIMVKGPVTPMIAAFCAVAMSAHHRRWKWLGKTRPLLGVLLVVLVVGAWVGLVARQVGLDHYLSIIRDEVLGRSLEPKEGHWGPPGYHAALFTGLFWPGALMAVLGLMASLGRVRRSRAARRTSGRLEAETFCLTWALPAWAVFEIVGTKLPHYTMPLLPALAILGARLVVAARGPVRRHLERGPLQFLTNAWLLAGLGLAVVAPVVLWALLGARLALWDVVGLALPALSAIVLVGAWQATRTGRWQRAQWLAIYASAAAIVSLVGIVFPRAPGLWISDRLAAEIARLDPAGARPIAAVGYHEDSLVFLTDGRAERLAETELASWVAGHPRGLVIMPQQSAESRTDLIPLAEASGYNYSKGRMVTLQVLAPAPGASD